MPPRRSGGESKQGLIIALVFFVLATIGLGVATYYGFAGQDALSKAAKDAKSAEDKAKADRDWYKFQALQYRSYMGVDLPPGGDEDLKAKRAEFDTPNAKLGSEASDRESATKLIRETLDSKFKWNPAAGRPTTTYEATLRQDQETIAGLAKANGTSKDQLADAQKKIQKADDDAKAAEDDYKKKLEDVSKKAQTDLADLVAKNNQLTEKIDALSQEREKIQTKAQADVKAAQDKLASGDKTIKSQQAVLEKFRQEQEQQNRPQEAPASWRTDWKVERVSGNTAYINLGSADNVKPQLSFSVHSVESGKPVPTPKANLEVVSVLQPHLSEARLTYTSQAGQNRGRDPVVAGDVLYNPLWDPSMKKHVALAGVMDLRGNGQDDLQGLMRLLARQNVVVDAYLDPRELTMKGPGMTVQTDYLILGESPENPGANRKENEATLKRDKILGDVQRDANQKGVKVISLRRYLELVGYRAPTTEPIQEETTPYRRSR